MSELRTYQFRIALDLDPVDADSLREAEELVEEQILTMRPDELLMYLELEYSEPADLDGEWEEE